MQVFLMICIGLLLASCGGERQPKPTVAAIESGEKTRMEWQKPANQLKSALRVWRQQPLHGPNWAYIWM